MSKPFLKGIVPPMIIPLLDNDTLDKEGTLRLIDHIIAGGVHGLFLLGTTGEAQSLSYKMRYEFVELACKHVAGRVPVLVGITDTSFDESVRLAIFAKQCGASALVAAPPYYFPANQAELLAYYTALADAVPLPLYLYNMPSKVKVYIDVPTVVALSKHPNIIGVKDSSGNAGYMADLIFNFKDSDFAVFIGPEEVTGQNILMGATGGVNGGANLFPELFVSMYNAAAAGDLEALLPIQQKIMFLSNTLYRLCKSDASFLKSIKTSCEFKGICSGRLAWPYQACTEEERAKIKAALDKLQDYR